jgi:hypothetical protein
MRKMNTKHLGPRACPRTPSRRRIDLVPRLPEDAEKRDARMTLRMPQRLRDAIGRASKRARRAPVDWILLTLEDACEASDAAAETKPEPKPRGR